MRAAIYRNFGCLLLGACSLLASAAETSCGTAPVAGSEAQLAFAKCSISNRQWAEAEEQIRAYRSRHSNSVDGALLDAEILIETNRFEDASQVLEPLVRLHPRSTPALTLYAELAEKLGNSAEAQHSLQQATQYAPNDPETWKRLADAYLKKQPKEAIRCFKRALELQPNDAVALAGLASAYHQAEEPAAARSNFARAIALNRKTNPPSAIVDYLYAVYLADNQEFRQSVSQYDLAIKEDPDFPDAYFARGDALGDLHEWAAATRDIERVASLPKYELRALALLVRLYRELGELEKAREYSKKLELASQERDRERVSGNEIAGQMQAATALLEQQKVEEASKVYGLLVLSHPEATRAWLQLGRCYMQLGKLDDAEPAFRKVISLDRSSVVAHVALAELLLKKNRTASARDEFTAARQIEPLNIDARLGLAATYILEKEYEPAIRILKETERVAPNAPPVSLMLAEALYKDDQRNAASLELNRLLKAEPGNQAAHQMLAAVSRQPAQAR